jgi:hypothetical protein
VTPVLTVGKAGRPWLGPRVFDDALLCPAKAAVTLMDFTLPAACRSEPLAKPSGGGWLAAAELLRELARLGPTSSYLVCLHTVTDLGKLAASLLPGESRSVREFAAMAAEAVLDAQASTAVDHFNYYADFVKIPFGLGQMHAGGALPFEGPAGKWQIWRLRTTTARPVNEASRNWAIMAAYCLAGYLDNDRRGPLQSVEVFEVGAAGGQIEHLGSWTRPAVTAEFGTLQGRVLRNMASDLNVHGGPHCATCTFVGNCPAAPRIEGLLQHVRRQRTVRKVSATDLRIYADCARRYQLLRVNGLPGEQLTGDAFLRGESVDAWLRSNHLRGDACGEDDVSQFLRATGDTIGAAMAEHHLAICPLGDLAATAGTFILQPDVAALDAASKALLVARPDAIYKRGGAVVWRETKTRATIDPRDAMQLVETDLTAAFYLTLLASGVTGPPDALEWEELTANGGELTVLPADDRDLVEAARAQVSASVSDLLGDYAYPPRVGVGCSKCPARRWCPDAP